MKLNKKLSKLLILLVLAGFSVGCALKVEVEDVEENSDQEVTKVEEKIPTEVFSKPITLVDDEVVKIVVKGKQYDQYNGALYNVEIDNKTDKDITVYADRVSVDGVMADTMSSIEINKGKKTKDSIYFTEITSIEELKNVEGTIEIVHDKDNRDTIAEYKFDIK